MLKRVVFKLKSIFLKLYKKIPFPMRTKFHRLKDLVNENSLILLLIGPTRHRHTMRKIQVQKSFTKLIVGESYARPNWFVTNYQVFARNFLDVRKRFSRNFLMTHIYADNVIEHLNFADGELFLSNAFQALEVGGRIRIVTPDTHAIARAYLNGDLKKTGEMAIDLNEHNLRMQHPIDMLHATFISFGHFKGRLYDQETLSGALSAAGFRDVRRFAPGISNDNNFKNLERRVGKSDSWGQLCLEATK